MGCNMRNKFNVLAASVLLVLTGCNTSGSDDDAVAIPEVSIIQVSSQRVEHTDRFIGKTEAVDSVDILPKVSGYLIERSFTEGTFVRKGDILYQIDPVPFEIEVERLTAHYVEIEAQYSIADKKYQKAVTLVSKNALSKLELEQLQAEREAISGQVNAAKADLKKAKLELSYTQIKAPFDGIVGASAVSVGSLVGPDSQPMTRINSSDSIYVSIQLDEKAYLDNRSKKMSSGSEIYASGVELELSNGAKYNQLGELNFTDNQVDTNNGSIQLRFKFPNPNALLSPGQFVTLISTQLNNDPVMLVPQKSVQEDQRGRYVLTVNDEQVVESKYISLGERHDDEWVVLSGLDVANVSLPRECSKRNQDRSSISLIEGSSHG